ncbi:MAG: ABC transporter ATP-binding protein [Flavobacteriales bacterium]|nr:ABC transporter ATP-binding protein [Flavobacteriales bacterium]
MNYLLESKNVVKKYSDKIALDDFSLAIPKGSIYGLLGPNGAGKTTFIRIINQITAPDSGEILFDGQKLQKHHIKQIGYMPEERGLYKNMKIGEQCIYLAQLKGMSKNQAKEKLNYWFEKLDIEKWWNKKLSELSKGMAQKIQFIVTVLHEPKLLIFDEPFSGFDPVNANLIRDEILELKQKGTTIIFSTHRMESVEELCDYTALINKSKKVLDGKIEDIKNQHKKNKFRVELTDCNAQLIQKIQENYFVENLNQEKEITTFTIKMDLKNERNFLNEITQTANLIHFSEVIPSMNEIFIENVN